MIFNSFKSTITLFTLSVLSIPVFAQETIDPKDTEVWEPEPVIVTPGKNQSPPSDAIILFD